MQFVFEKLTCFCGWLQGRRFTGVISCRRKDRFLIHRLLARVVLADAGMLVGVLVLRLLRDHPQRAGTLPVTRQNFGNIPE